METTTKLLLMSAPVKQIRVILLSSFTNHKQVMQTQYQEYSQLFYQMVKDKLAQDLIQQRSQPPIAQQVLWELHHAGKLQSVLIK